MEDRRRRQDDTGAMMMEGLRCYRRLKKGRTAVVLEGGVRRWR
ncbi:hypothetical protein L195_g049022, partial [Trifolium pratense]